MYFCVENEYYRFVRAEYHYENSIFALLFTSGIVVILQTI